MLTKNSFVTTSKLCSSANEVISTISLTNILQSKGFNKRTNSWPILPSPIIPIVFPVRLNHPFLFHTPSFNRLEVEYRFLESININPNAISATDRLFTPPVQPITTLRFAHASKSILSRPTPNFAIILSLGNFSKTKSSINSNPTIAPSASDKYSINESPLNLIPS